MRKIPKDSAEAREYWETMTSIEQLNALQQSSAKESKFPESMLQEKNYLFTLKKSYEW